MKTNFKTFRHLCRISQFLVIIGIISLVVIMTMLDGENSVHIAVVVFVVFGLIGGILSCVAGDYLICPRCGKRITKENRLNPLDKEERAQLKALLNGGEVVCVNCGARIDTRT